MRKNALAKYRRNRKKENGDYQHHCVGTVTNTARLLCLYTDALVIACQTGKFFIAEVKMNCKTD